MKELLKDLLFIAAVFYVGMCHGCAASKAFLGQDLPRAGKALGSCIHIPEETHYGAVLPGQPPQGNHYRTTLYED